MTLFRNDPDEQRALIGPHESAALWSAVLVIACALVGLILVIIAAWSWWAGAALAWWVVPRVK